MKKLLPLLFVFLSIHLNAQTIDTILHIHKTDSTVLNIPVTDIDSLTFSYDTLIYSYRISGKVFDSINNIVDSGEVFLLLLNLLLFIDNFSNTKNNQWSQWDKSRTFLIGTWGGW